MPEPSRLVLLEQLPGLEQGTKVRFLACVHGYNIDTATLQLKNRYPAHGPDVPTALVNVDALLGSLDHDLLQVGTWLNIVGHVRTVLRRRRSRRRRRQDEQDAPIPEPVRIDATLVWSAGAIALDKYTAAVLEFQKPLEPE